MIYLPTSVYEGLPYGYVAGGLLLAIVSYGETDPLWSNLCLAVGGIGVLAGIVLVLRRRSSRADAARYDPHSLDEP